MKKYTLVLCSILLCILIASSLLFWYRDMFLRRSDTSKDENVEIQDKNKEFQNGNNALINGDSTWAIEHFEKSKDWLTSASGLAIIDFNIASARFEQDRNNGVASYSDLANNELYPRRTRALALHRAYLMYRRYNDESLLRTLAEKNNIVWTNTEEVKYKYMLKSYWLYPLPGSSIFLMKVELSNVTSKEDAELVVSRYKESIEAGISAMKERSWELVEATSAMLGYNNVLGSLFVKYALGSREILEKNYKELIQFDQERNFTTNKQYTFLYYWDFLAQIGDYRSAVSILQLLASESLDRSLIEALPKSKEFTSLSKIPSDLINNPDISKIINEIGSANK